jgi:hypothetical protein
MNNQYFLNLYLLSNLDRFIQERFGDSKMFSPEMYYLANIFHEEYKRRMQEIERGYRLRDNKPLPDVSPRLPRKAISWLGMQMVKWGSKLQSYDSATQKILTGEVNNHPLKYSR